LTPLFFGEKKMEYRFRAWNRQTRKMHIVIRLELYFEDYNKVCALTASQKNIFPEDLVILQFTNHYDLRKREIFAGHIVSFTTPLNQKRIGFIEYYVPEARFRVVVPSYIEKKEDIYTPGGCDGSYYGLKQLIKPDILGNIYENPEIIWDVCLANNV
jgi:hypothetical protein